MSDTPFFNRQPEGLQPTEVVPQNVSEVLAGPQAPQALEVPDIDMTDGTEPVYELFDHVNKAVLKVPETDLPMAIQSGQYTLPKDLEVPVISPDGKFGTIPAAKAKEAFEAGYQIEPYKARQERQLRDKYGEYEGTAAALGLARGATFGLSDQLLTQTGAVNPETLRLIQEENEVASLVGEVGSLFVPTGLGGKAVKAGINAVEGVGKAAEAQVLKALNKEAKDTVSKSIASKIAARASGSAVEGAFYGAGQLISEDALGRADFNAENLAAYIGTGAILGGALGGTIQAGIEAVAPVAKIIGRQAKKTGETLVDRELAASDLIGLTPLQAKKLKDRNPAIFQDLPDFLVKDAKLQRFDTTDDLIKKIEQVREEAGQKIGQVLDDLEEMSITNPALRRDKNAMYARIADDLEVEILKRKDTPGYSTQLKSTQEFINDIRKLSATTFDTSVREIQQLRQNVDELINFEKVPNQRTFKEEIAYAFRKSLRREIDGIAEQASAIRAAEGASDSIAQALKDSNKKYAIAEEALDALGRKSAAERNMSLKDTILAGVGVGGGVDAAALVGGYTLLRSDLRKRMVVLREIENANIKVGKAVNGAVKGFMSGIKPIPRIASMTLTDSFFANGMTEDKPKKPKSQIEAYNNTVENLEKFAQNPDLIMERANRTTSAMYDTAPETSAAVDMIAANGAAFLASKVPKKLAQPSSLAFLETPRMPSSQEISKFMRYVKGVEQPLTVLEDMEKGVINREGIEAMKNVYPDLFSRVQDTLMEQLSKPGAKLPYNKKVQLGILFDTPTDASLQPQNVVGLQANFGPEPTSEDGAVSTTQGGLNNVNPASRLASDLERLESGE